MAGHSKWANIQHRKKAVDVKRGKIFTRINRELVVAAREGGGDPDSNPRLRLAMDKANAANMPKDNIERAIKRGTGEIEGADYVEMNYEGYAPGGIAILVEALTDNTNRTVADVRAMFAKSGGSLGTAGSVAYQFDRRSVRIVAKQDELADLTGRFPKVPGIEEFGREPLTPEPDVLQCQVDQPESSASIRKEMI